MKIIIYLVVIFFFTGCSEKISRSNLRDFEEISRAYLSNARHLRSVNSEEEESFIANWDRDSAETIAQANQNLGKIRKRNLENARIKEEKAKKEAELKAKRLRETKRLAREAKKRIEIERQAKIAARIQNSNEDNNIVGTSRLNKARESGCTPSELIGAADDCNIRHTFTNPNDGKEIDVTIDMAPDISGVYEICARDINFPEGARTYELNSDGTGYLEYHGKGEPRIDIEWGVRLKEGNVVPENLFIRGDQYLIYQIIYTKDNGKLGLFKMYNLDGEPVINGPASFAMKRGCY